MLKECKQTGDAEIAEVLDTQPLPAAQSNVT